MANSGSVNRRVGLLATFQAPSKGRLLTSRRTEEVGSPDLEARRRKSKGIAPADPKRRKEKQPALPYYLNYQKKPLLLPFHFTCLLLFRANAQTHSNHQLFYSRRALNFISLVPFVCPFCTHPYFSSGYRALTRIQLLWFPSGSVIRLNPATREPPL